LENRRNPKWAERVSRAVLGLIILIALLGLAFTAYRWRRNRVQTKVVLEREQRRREQQEAWDRMLADMARERRAKDGDLTDAVEA
jgi:primosomal protein N''